jgi:hypothetical protein
MVDLYHVTRDEGRFEVGSFTWSELVARAKRGEIEPTDMVILEGNFEGDPALDLEALWSTDPVAVPPHLDPRFSTVDSEEDEDWPDEDDGVGIGEDGQVWMTFNRDKDELDEGRLEELPSQTDWEDDSVEHQAGAPGIASVPQSQEYPTSPQRRAIHEFLTSKRHKPRFDDDGNLVFRVWAPERHPRDRLRLWDDYLIQFISDDPTFYLLCYPAFLKIEKGGEPAALAALNEANMHATGAKVLMIESYVWAICELICTSPQEFIDRFPRSLSSIDVATGLFCQALTPETYPTSS